MVIHTANRPSHERENIQISSLQGKTMCISTVLWVLSHLAQWHNVLAFRTSRTSGTSRKCPGKHRHFRDDPLACTGTLLACWHSRQTHGTGKLMMTHHSPIWRLWWHTQMMWSVYWMVMHGCRWWCEVDVFSESEQALGNQSTLRNWPNPINWQK